MSEKLYHWSVNQVVHKLATNLETGLSLNEAKIRLQKTGLNQLKETKSKSPLALFLDQFKDLIIWVLIAAALISGFLKEWVDAAAILGIIILNAVLGFIQEYRAEKSLQALKKLSSPNSKVIRNGELKIVPSAELVPGDLIELEAGDNIPADCRLNYISANFATQEASLTGESTPVSKTIAALAEKEVGLADRANMVYMGTYAVAGRARAIVVSTGMQTELGKIAGLIQQIEDETTPLQKKLEQFGKWIVYLCFILVGLVFLIEIRRGEELFNVFLTAVSLAVAAIPEGLPAVVTIALALGVQRMVKRHALIRKLPSVETLGAATVICSDKTGTLTKNEMTVKAIYAGGKLFNVSGIGYEPKGEFLLNGNKVAADSLPELAQALTCGVLCNGATLFTGDPTERAILIAAAKAGFIKESLKNQYVFVEEIAFDSVRKKMTMVYKLNGKYVVFVKGAPEILIEDCPGLTNKEEILKVNSELANKAMRVLALAYREMDQTPLKYDAKTIETGLTFLGLVAMIDPPREEVKEAINKCKTAGIKVIMITGDHQNTAGAIAKELGIATFYARVSPERKLEIVRLLKKQGEVVAMTGDGVNDAPAVKEADIGVAMGITGTDVTKEVSDMVITDDNFASIVAAVEEGRGIYSNIRKFIHYLLSCNAGEILVMFFASLVGLPIPLYPIHILWVNLVTDGFPALALGVDPVDPNIMQEQPRPINEAVITKDRAVLMLMQGTLIAFCTLLAFVFILYVQKECVEHARTVAFAVLALSQLFHAFNCRSQSVSLFKLGLFTNLNLIYAFIVSFLLQMGVIYLPFLQPIFKTVPLSLFDWALVVMISSLPLWGMEAVKTVRRRF